MISKVKQAHGHDPNTPGVTTTASSLLAAFQAALGLLLASFHFDLRRT